MATPSARASLGWYQSHKAVRPRGMGRNVGTGDCHRGMLCGNCSGDMYTNIRIFMDIVRCDHSVAACGVVASCLSVPVLARVTRFFFRSKPLAMQGCRAHKYETPSIPLLKNLACVVRDSSFSLFDLRFGSCSEEEFLSAENGETLLNWSLSQLCRYIRSSTSGTRFTHALRVAEDLLIVLGNQN